MPIQQGDEIEVISTVQGQTRIATRIGHVSSISNGNIGITFPNGEREWKVAESAIEPIGEGKWKFVEQVSTDPAKLL